VVDPVEQMPPCMRNSHLGRQPPAQRQPGHGQASLP
jgi:hypothetical protein